ncbi:hypothetical protein [Actinokineospora xionganensis]|uniref:ATP-binding protein n=1 Tax=Actinokineospora xionganensis TaxID=2684470 RepID=A0ABR7L7T6_9PSEU|nr:hypothetical protein [Actinokineospora xionganensis]MBC6448608.1 hypothetical protein [Actinokineospora xionganensis]
MAYRPDEIRKTTLREAVRSRPRMYFGADRDDPALPGLVLRLVVDDARCDGAVRVEIQGDPDFTVTDDGVGMPLVTPDGRAWPPVAVPGSLSWCSGD